ncbi:MAG: DUF2914 domain-containing protein [Candidatus Methylomirabilales bacterium]
MRMRTWTTIVLTGLIVVGLPRLARAQEKPQETERQMAGSEVVRDAVAAAISDREPVDASQVFSPTIGTIYYFTAVRSPRPPTEITHVWYHGEREVARVTLSVNGPIWRTWSSKRILPTWTGSWRVEALTPEGTVLASQDFSVEPSPVAEPAPTAQPAPVAQPAPAMAPGPASEAEKR